MDIFLQIIGGVFYLLNKIFLLISENTKDKLSQKWRIASWISYLIGLPAWIIIFVIWQNWIAASVEASGLPAMIMGLIIALRGKGKKAPKWLDWLALICIPIGFAYSVYDHSGLSSLNQWLEIILVLGFLIGTYQLAKHKKTGYLWYIIMHLACGWLMYIQDYPWLCTQQIISLIFIVWAWFSARNKKEEKQTVEI